MRTLAFLKKFKRQLLEPHPSESHPGHFLTFLEMSNLVKLPEEQRSELEKCQICPNWSFISVTEQTRHRKHLLYKHKEELGHKRVRSETAEKSRKRKRR